MPDKQKRLDDFLTVNPDIERLEIMIPDMNGMLRGKWLPKASISKILDGSARIPLATYCGDIWGNDVDAAGVAAALGDPDGKMVPDLDTLVLIPWAARSSAQVFATIKTDENVRSPFDPRELVRKQVAKLAKRGLTPVVAAELEFHLFTKRDRASQPPTPPHRTGVSSVFSVEDMAEIETCLNAIQDAAKIQNLPVDTIIAEYGSGQFEINLIHTNDALKAADQAMMLKRLIRGVARAHDLEASFMAKPYGDGVGSGMHVHVSLLDDDGNSIFADKVGINTPLKHAIGGLMDSMHDFQLCFTPHLNSYRRIAADYFEASKLSWGQDNRNLTIRVPDHVSSKGARLEHRISGADTNPYLVIAAILAGIEHGLENQLDPGKAFELGDPEPQQKLHLDWRPAIDQFSKSKIVGQHFGAEMQRVFSVTKNAEASEFNAYLSVKEIETYSMGI